MTSEITSKSIYTHFGVSENASTKDIEVAYRRLATQWHPSKHAGDRDAPDRFEQLATAFFVVTDSTERNRYFTYLRSGLSTPYKLAQTPTPGVLAYERVVLRHAEHLAPHCPTREDLERALRAEAIPESLVQRAITSVEASVVKPGKITPAVQPESQIRAAGGTHPPRASQPDPAPPQLAPLPAGMVFAGFWERAAACFLDGVVLVIAYLLIAAGCSLIAARSGRVLEGAVVCNVLALIVGLSYFSLLESANGGATLGKRALHLHVVDLGGARISLFRAVMRHLARYLSALPMLFGYLVQPYTERKQALHDMLTGTLVVRDIGVRANHSAVTIAIIAGTLGLVSTTGGVAAIALPRLDRYEKQLVIDAGMADARRAVAQLETMRLSHAPLPAQLHFAHTEAIAEVAYDVRSAAVKVAFRPAHGLGNRPLVAYPSARNGRMCYFLPGETGSGLGNCPASEPSLLDPARLN